MWTLAIIAAGYLLLIGALIFGPSVASYVNITQFNSAEWKSHLNNRNSIKLNML